MYGKWFDSAYTGSLCGAGADVFAVMTYAVAHTWNSCVELNPVLIAGLIGMPVENVEKAIEYLCKPDPRSRNPDEEGRRLVYLSGYRYRVVSQKIYRGLRTAEDRREYMREKQQEHRARTKPTGVNHCQPASTIVNPSQPRQPKSTNITEVAEVAEVAEVTEATEPTYVIEEKLEAQRSERSRQPESSTAHAHTHAVMDAGEKSPAGSFSSFPFRGRGIPAEAYMIAKHVAEKIGVTTSWIINEITAQAKLELESGTTKDELRDGMMTQWNRYQKCVTDRKTKSTSPMNAQRFFGEGIWKDSLKWGLKKGMTAD